MKARIIISLFSIILAAFLVISGLTLAWFTDEAVPTVNPIMTTGTVDFEIISAEFTPESVEWKPGEENTKNFTWTLENTGSKKAYFRARLIEEIGKQESATGYGTAPGKNWFMYFEVPAGEKTKIVDLVSGAKHKKVGSVIVDVDRAGKKVSVIYKTDSGFGLLETHLAIVNHPNDFEMAGNNNLIPGQAEFSAKHELQGEYTYSGLKPTNVDLNKTIYVFAHAAVVVPEGDSFEGVNWSSNSGDWKRGNNPDDWWYYCKPVMPGDSVTLDLTASNSYNGKNSLYYNVKIEAEAMQASNNAVKIWPNYPCDHSSN